MGKYEDIISLRKELKKPSVFQHNSIQFRMLMWHITIRFSLAFKRVMDIVLSLIALLLGSPVFIITALLVKCTSPGPIIFSQVRVGNSADTSSFTNSAVCILMPKPAKQSF